ncbi:glycine--tRNA ligase subunit beta [Candidatus Pseudomonas adelgestsugas]|uniref:Glycine--tRNA ligase beta subunit n=1 Tax=Candidatus Pseudomonas adelgestsugas TaxID=1302376 RepID=A0ABX5RAU2_9PSED|nr:glycine--tRNA ligase subunit beta [Candidatus Pseudomonas adelgestsugas]QAX82311.1 Glycine--tRNA ligase beta subunit [Candidatus Pseudomonas adelgestsugas]
MSVQDFLVEIGTEELPPKALDTLSNAFMTGIEKGLYSANLKFATKKVYSSPRRLAVLLTALETQQQDYSINFDGPSRQVAFNTQGKPTQAALGFAKKCGVELSKIDQSGPKLRFSQIIAGQPTYRLLQAIVKNSLNELPIPKRMRWGTRKEEFVRPTKWLVMLLGSQVIDCTILAQEASRHSRGHRFHHPEHVHITSPANYATDLRTAYVIADANERRELIRKRIEELAHLKKGIAIVPPGLLEEVTALVEWPVPLMCSFEEHFLNVPQEALIITLQENQKYFCLLDLNGKLLPHFIAVANIKSKDPQQIIAGNEKVVRARLNDAEFFFKQDKKQKLQCFNLHLQNVVFQEKLGSVYDKALRISKLAAYIAQRIGGDANLAARAGLLSKCDLATDIVGEFPEMQGIAGYYYAINDGEPYDVAIALHEQYMPRNPSATLPSTLTGAAVAIADNLDTLIAIFGIGMLPTGSKDPYALRRAAVCILRVLIDKKLDLDLTQTIVFAINQFGGKVNKTNLVNLVLEFVLNRLRASYEEDGVDISVYLSVRAIQPSSMLDFDQRVQAVQAFRKLPEADALSTANKRVSNLLRKNINLCITEVNPGLFADAKEFSLNSAIAKAENALKSLLAERNYTKALMHLATLREPVDAFFEAVIINTKDVHVQKNRYAMLARLRDLFLNVADISILN